jgi:hypothetical protein
MKLDRCRPKKLTLLDLLNLANDAYPDGFLAEY